jgi:hypothetical protein
LTHSRNNRAAALDKALLAKAAREAGVTLVPDVTTVALVPATLPRNFISPAGRRSSGRAARIIEFFTVNIRNRLLSCAGAKGRGQSQPKTSPLPSSVQLFSTFLSPVFNNL